MEESQGLEPCRTGGVLVVLDKKVGGGEDKGGVNWKEEGKTRVG